MSPPNQEETRQLRLTVGILNGLLLGIGLSLGAWTISALRLSRIAVPLQMPNLALGLLLLVIICGLGGLITSRWHNGLLSILTWLVAAILSALVIGYEPYYGRTFIVWLYDRRFWGWPIYPPPEGLGPALVIFTGLFIILLLAILALLQDYRLEAICREQDNRGRLLARGWLLLLLPLPFAALAGYVTNDISGDKSAYALHLVHQAIEVGRTYEGDLFQLGLADGINYSALNSVRDQMSATYVLSLSGIDAASASTFVIAYFGNGAWVRCRVINNQLSFCADAAPPYTTGFISLINGESPPENCYGCQPVADETWLSWLRARRDQLDPPTVSRLAQWGSYALMQVSSPSGSFAVQCWLSGLSTPRLERCQEIESQPPP